MIDPRRLKIHPLCAALPEMTDDEFDELKLSMRAHRFLEQEPIWLLDGQIVDGRNRYRAAMAEQVPAVYRQLKLPPGTSLVEWIIATNIRRRHLTAAQRTACVAKLRAEAKAMETPPPPTEPEYIPDRDEPDYDAEIPDDEYRTEDREPTIRPGAPLQLSGPYEEKRLSKAEIADLEADARAAGVSPRSVREAEQIGAKDPAALDRIIAGESSIRAEQRRQRPASELEACAKIDAHNAANRAATWRDNVGFACSSEVYGILHDPEYERVKQLAENLRNALIKLAKTKSGAWVKLKTESAMNTLIVGLKWAQPWTVCLSGCMPPETTAALNVQPCRACMGTQVNPRFIGENEKLQALYQLGVKPGDNGQTAHAAP